MAASLQAVATPAQPDPLGTLLNQNTNYANIIAGAHPDPIPNNLVNLLVENPLGPQLDAAFKALPSLQVRTSPTAELQILSFSCVTFKTLIARHHACSLQNVLTLPVLRQRDLHYTLLKRH